MMLTSVGEYFLSNCFEQLRLAWKFATLSDGSLRFFSSGEIFNYCFVRNLLLKPNSITLSSSLAGRRPFRDQIPLHYPVCDQLASRSTTISRYDSRAGCELLATCRKPGLDSVMEFGLKLVAERVFKIG